MSANNNRAVYQKVETSNFLLIVLTFLVVAVGGLVEIVPLFFQKSTTEPLLGLSLMTFALAGARCLYSRRLLQLPLANDSSFPCRNDALWPLFCGW